MSVWSVVFSCVCQSCFARSTEQQFRRCCHVGVQKCRPFYVRSVEPVVKVDGHRSQSVGWIEVVRAICLFFLFKSLTIHLSIYVFLHSTRCVRTRMGKLANNGHAGQLPRAKVSGWSATLTSSSRRAVVRSDRSRDLHLGSGYHWASVSSLSGGLVRPLAGAQKKTPFTSIVCACVF
ncbi:hypothetical protein T06_14070 [Trichinella sp. T6]|nr:hypothetical protein T06_14070 [Trichinella sp. T6]